MQCGPSLSSWRQCFFKTLATKVGEAGELNPSASVSADAAQCEIRFLTDVSRGNLDQRIDCGPWPRSFPVLAAAAFAASLVWTLIVRWPLANSYGADNAVYAEIAHLWRHGALPYASAFDVKPPGLFALIAAAETFFGPTLEAIRSITIVSDAIAAAALFLLARRFGGMRVGVFAAALYPPLSLIAVNSDACSPVAAMTALAFLAALSPLPLFRRALLAGLAIGAAGTVKQTAGFEALALLAVLLSASAETRQRAQAALVYGAGVACAPVDSCSISPFTGRRRP